LQAIRRITADTQQRSLFQTLLVVQQEPLYNMAGEDSGLFKVEASEDGDRPQGNVDLFNTYGMMIECWIKPRGVGLHISVDEQVIKRKQVRRMVGQLDHVLQQLCASGTDKLQVMDIGTAGEEDIDDIWTWNATLPATVNACVHDLIAERTQQQPDAPAICAWDGKMTYHELDELSTRLAHHLAGLGVGRDTIVPLCFEKSIWMPVSMLGVMKAGGASVALDPSQPIERLRSIVGQITCTIILSSVANRALADKLGVKNLMFVDGAILRQLQIPGKCLSAVDPSSWLYVVFTSGTTGKPKGAIITHSNFSSAIKHQQHILCLDSTSRVFDFASYAFDTAWSNILHSFTAGACLCIPSETARRNDIAGSMEEMAITYVDLTPSTARLIDPATVPNLQTLILGGEPMTTEDIATWANKVDLKNLYGPAECSVTATAADVDQRSGEAASLGCGIGLNTWVTEVYEHGRLAPIGAIGELWLEGPLVGQGYLADPVKTTASFVEDPPWLLRGGPGYPGRRGRLYRTGDLVRYNEDGTLVFVGRKDAQVKIRGQRVELGEVEHYVRRNIAEGFEQSVVAEVIIPQANNNPALAVFVAIGEAMNKEPHGVKTTLRDITQGLEERLAEQLPGYMVPIAYIPIDKIPMTVTGKTDRRQLREIGEALTLEQLADLQP
ncbi:hypothetical protein ETB97_012310, partial [Aspergillus alliaceus]